MNTTHSRRALLAAFCAALIALILAAAGAAAADTDVAAAAAGSVGAPIVTIDGGAVRGVAVPGGYAFRGLPYAAAPTGQLRWRAPRPAGRLERCPRRDPVRAELPAADGPVQNLFLPPGPIAEDCLYLNVSTPDAAQSPRRWSPGARLDPRRRPHSGCRPQLRRLQARGGGHRRRHDQLPARRARLPRAPGARRRGRAARPATTA